MAPIENYTIVEVHRSQLKNAPYNPRISEKAKRKLKDGIKRVGLLAPLTWNVRSGNIVGGHRRLEILDALHGTEDYSLRVAQTDLDDTREREANLLLNNPEAQGEWDMELLEKMVSTPGIDLAATGFDVADIYQLFGDAPLATNQLDELATRLKAAQGWYDDLTSGENKNAGGPTDFYLVVVFRDPNDRDQFLADLRLPDNRFQDGRELRRLFDVRGSLDNAPLPSQEKPPNPVDPSVLHSMKLATRRELDKARELVRFLLIGKTCFFCRKALVDEAILVDTPAGERGRPLGEILKITTHHIDGDHDHDAPDNLALCHQSCHRAHHRAEENRVNPPRRRRSGVEDVAEDA